MNRITRHGLIALLVATLFVNAHGQTAAPPSPQEPTSQPAAVPGAAGQAAEAASTPTTPAEAPAAIAPTARSLATPRAKPDHHGIVKPADTVQPVLWEQPESIATRNLFYGQGGEKHQPKPPFVFEKEDKGGTNPKFDVTDGDGKKWRVKLGEEPRPEVVASRLLWAVGYFAQDDYLLPTAHVGGLKIDRKSGNEKGEEITDARFARKPGGQDKLGNWKWSDNPFMGTQEYDGLRVMMALINNWDLKDDNNDVYQDTKTGNQIYIVRDIGATFGTNGLSWTRSHSKGNLASYRGSKFITRNSGGTVDFGTPAAPAAYLLKTFGFGAIGYVERVNMEKIGKQIPLEHVRWVAKLLAQLTHEQIADAFRAGHLPAEDADIYVQIVESRIAELKSLAAADTTR